MPNKISITTLVMMNVVAVLSLRGLPAEAFYGMSSIFYYVFAAIFFLVPVALVAAELTTGWPESGGIFRWIGEAFGYKMALLGVFMIWIHVITWFFNGINFWLCIACLYKYRFKC